MMMKDDFETTMIANKNFGHTDLTASLEYQIRKYPKLASHLPAVLTYLRIDLVLLESVSYIRQEGFWDASTSDLYRSVLLMPSATQTQALATLCPMLFLSPPSDLFNLVCQYRLQTRFQPTGLADRLTYRWSSVSKQIVRRGGLIRTAPTGEWYVCPSLYCKKRFKKAGHTQNHISRCHPEYLQLHPDFQPQLSTNSS